MTSFVTFAGLHIALPTDWDDITTELPSDTPPTLARCNGVGALQFSVAKYVSGPVPDIDATELRGFLTDLGSRRGLSISSLSAGVGRNRFVVGTHEAGGELIRVWYVTNARDLALVTYVASE